MNDRACTSTQGGSSLTDSNPPSSSTKTDGLDPCTILKNLKLANINRPIFAHININSLRNKFDSLKTIIKDNVDILVISETKLDESFPISQFTIIGYSLPFRIDRNANGGGLLLYVRDNLPCRKLNNHSECNTFEGIFLEINLRKTKWLIFGGYNHNKSNIDNYLSILGPALDFYMSKYENWLLIGDLNSELQEHSMNEFCNLYNLHNLVKEPTCYKNLLNPSSIDLLLTNKPKSFQNTFTIETGLSDFHKMIVTVLRSFIPKQTPICIKYRDFKTFNSVAFNNALIQGFNSLNPDFINYECFKAIFMELLNPICTGLFERLL
jgi:exonuclease III